MSTHDMAGKVNLLAVLVATIVLADSGVVATQRPQEIKQYLAQTSVQGMCLCLSRALLDCVVYSLCTVTHRYQIMHIIMI